MNKINLELSTVGNVPAMFNGKKMLKWKSSLFNVPNEIKQYELSHNSDLREWGYSDSLLSKIVKLNDNSDTLSIIIVNVPLEDNFYCRRLNDKTIVISFWLLRRFRRHCIPSIFLIEKPCFITKLNDFLAWK